MVFSGLALVFYIPISQPSTWHQDWGCFAYVRTL